MSLSRIVSEDQRLIILRVLSEDAGYSHNEYVIQAALAQLGHHVSGDVVKTQIAWLEEQDLLTTEDNGVLIATLSTRGDDVAHGRATVPGVKRPRPGA